MSLLPNKSGFAAFAMILIVAVIIVVTVFGYRAYSLREAATGSDQPNVATDVPAAPAVDSEEDLTTAEDTLDEVDMDSSQNDLNQLDSQSSDF